MCQGVKKTGDYLHFSEVNTVGYCIGTGSNLQISIYEELLGPIAWI